MRRSVHVLVGVGVIIFGFFVWPTMYRYDKMNMKWPIRINRVTGATYMLTPSGWSRVDSASSNTQSSPNSNASGVPVFQPTPVPKPNLSCQDVNLVKGAFGTYAVTGIVLNTGDGSSSSRVVNVTVFSKGGAVLASGTGFVSGIAAGGQGSFSIPLIGFIQGAQVDHVDATVN